MTKNEWRSYFRTQRAKLTQAEVAYLSDAIIYRLTTLSLWEFKVYHVFLSIEKNNEPNTTRLLNLLWGKEKKVVVSCSDFTQGTMQHFLLNRETDLQLNAFGIPEPVNAPNFPVLDIDVVFVPLLGVDKLGNRLGYGKGFYDRFLGECRPDTLKVGLSFFDPIEVFQEVYPHDIRLDYCVTPHGVYQF